MKKSVGRYYPAEFKKALSWNISVSCATEKDENGKVEAIYLTDGYAVYKFTPWEYAQVAQPITCREAGDWRIDVYGNPKEPIPAKTLKGYLNAAYDTPATRCPLELPNGKGKTTAAVYGEDGTAVAVNKAFINTVAERRLIIWRDIDPIIAVDGNDEPFAALLPIRIDKKFKAAVKAYMEADK